jgi:hypothetical protein
MKGVQFSVDHYAILWCFQLVGKVLRGMDLLSRSANSDDQDLLIRSFPTTSRYEVNKTKLSTISHRNITALARFVERNESMSLWKKAAADERKAMERMLHGNKLKMVAFNFIARKISVVPLCYLIISLLVLTVPIFRSLTSNWRNSALTEYTGMNALFPWVHLNLDVTIGPFLHFCQCFLPPGWVKYVLYFLVSALSVILLSLAYFVVWLGLESPSLALNSFYLIIAYGASISLRAFLLLTVAIVHSIWRTVKDLCWTLLRYTICSKAIRRSWRKALKFIKEKIGWQQPAPVSLFRYFVPSAIISAFVSIWIIGMDRIHGPDMHLGYMVYAISVTSILSYAAAALGIVFGCVFPPYDPRNENIESKYYTSFNDILLLYLPVILLGWPSFYFAVQLVGGDAGYMALTHHSSPELSTLFGPERIHYCIFLTAIAYHVWLARYPRYGQIFFIITIINIYSLMLHKQSRDGLSEAPRVDSGAVPPEEKCLICNDLGVSDEFECVGRTWFRVSGVFRGPRE